jgi:hypothetical protein
MEKEQETIILQPNIYRKENKQPHIENQRLSCHRAAAGIVTVLLAAEEDSMAEGAFDHARRLVFLEHFIQQVASRVAKVLSGNRCVFQSVKMASRRCCYTLFSIARVELFTSEPFSD